IGWKKFAIWSLYLPCHSRFCADSQLEIQRVHRHAQYQWTFNRTTDRFVRAAVKVTVFSTSRLSNRLTAFNTRRGLLLAIVLLLGTFAFTSNASAQTYKISGHVTDGFSNSIVGAKVELSGAQTSNTTTDSAGNYSFSNLAAGGTYNLHATMPGNTLTFTRTISNLSSDLIADLQILFFVNFQILVRDVSGVGIAAVGIRVNNEPYIFAQTNSFGLVNIGIGVPITGNGPPVTFTPDKHGYVFAPPTATLSTQNG